MPSLKVAAAASGACLISVTWKKRATCVPRNKKLKTLLLFLVDCLKVSHNKCHNWLTVVVKCSVHSHYASICVAVHRHFNHAALDPAPRRQNDAATATPIIAKIKMRKKFRKNTIEIWVRPKYMYTDFSLCIRVFRYSVWTQIKMVYFRNFLASF
jgi:hypothetical protein